MGTENSLCSHVKFFSSFYAFVHLFHSSTLFNLTSNRIIERTRLLHFQNYVYVKIHTLRAEKYFEKIFGKNLRKKKNGSEDILYMFPSFSSLKTYHLLPPCKGIREVERFLTSCFHSNPNRNNWAWDRSWFES